MNNSPGLLSELDSIYTLQHCQKKWKFVVLNLVSRLRGELRIYSFSFELVESGDLRHPKGLAKSHQGCSLLECPVASFFSRSNLPLALSERERETEFNSL